MHHPDEWKQLSYVTFWLWWNGHRCLPAVPFDESSSLIMSCIFQVLGKLVETQVQAVPFGILKSHFPFFLHSDRVQKHELLDVSDCSQVSYQLSRMCWWMGRTFKPLSLQTNGFRVRSVVCSTAKLSDWYCWVNLQMIKFPVHNLSVFCFPSLMQLNFLWAL